MAEKEVIKLTPDERKVVVDALEFKIKQHERASKTYSDNSLGGAHADLAARASKALFKINNLSLEL